MHAGEQKMSCRESERLRYLSKVTEETAESESRICCLALGRKILTNNGNKSQKEEVVTRMSCNLLCVKSGITN